MENKNAELEMWEFATMFAEKIYSQEKARESQILNSARGLQTSQLWLTVIYIAANRSVSIFTTFTFTAIYFAFLWSVLPVVRTKRIAMLSIEDKLLHLESNFDRLTSNSVYRSEDYVYTLLKIEKDLRQRNDKNADYINYSIVAMFASIAFFVLSLIF